MKQLVLGGIRSGKSQFAELLVQQQAQQLGLSVTYIATATALDDEMAQRIKTHRQRRPHDWRLTEEPLYLSAALEQSCQADRCVLVDCLSLWQTNLLLKNNAQLHQQETESLLQALPQLPGAIVFVSTESGLGLVPDNVLARQYCDTMGKLHQQLAALCDEVVLTVAGLPTYLKRAI
ncbi:MAG: bifunctional adenosylcobinamide kinase/adenosylcobinamide-phosphate guanylyltransferase [Gammaproteobacteria bacterium]|nr:bifunctional adenosylcobinamide kinase/adenosylcobinamide-phosphate guanylyltransferase [Gammaproteobacteria bacterium]MDH5802186.1 bifunctional adenosylcobinamide kinase/adenosylcobinamide-phosphate guanylyltransferase [Gammaproteobacteria bacterium]